jgi:peptidoglycan/LPS O-acetylase OafA/YrhL
MIQRIQSVYLFLALLALGALFSRLPLITLNGTAANDTLLIVEELFIGLSAFITLFSIFLYANRKRQMMAVKGAILLTVIALFAIAADYFTSMGKEPEGLIVDPFVVIGTVVLILQILGHRGIAADEKLVRQADRLR